jgi:hypothetical protein
VAPLNRHQCTEIPRTLAALPLSRAPGISKSVTCPESCFTTTRDWRVASLGWVYTLLFFVMPGSSAALWGLARARGPAQGWG